MAIILTEFCARQTAAASTPAKGRSILTNKVLSYKTKMPILSLSHSTLDIWPEFKELTRLKLNSPTVSFSMKGEHSANCLDFYH
jgi:hypothetical protein